MLVNSLKAKQEADSPLQLASRTKSSGALQRVVRRVQIRNILSASGANPKAAGDTGILSTLKDADWVDIATFFQKAGPEVCACPPPRPMPRRLRCARVLRALPWAPQSMQHCAEGGTRFRDSGGRGD